MISYADIRVCYNKLYEEIRKYIWDFHTVEALADLEIACYQTCPDISNIRYCLSELHTHISSLFTEDEELQRAYEALHDLIYSEDEYYVKLNKVQEVIEDEDK